MLAVQHADMLCGWQENYSRAEMPPRWMWPFPKLCLAHFKEVEEDRKAGRKRADDDDDEDGPTVERNPLEAQWLAERGIPSRR